MAIGTYISIIILNINGLNAPIKRHRLAEGIQKQDPYICCLQKTHFRPKDPDRLKVRGWKNIFHANGNQKKAGVKVKSFSRVQLFVIPWTVAYQASPLHRILQARVLKWVAISFSRGSSWPRNWTRVSRIAGRHFIWLPLGLIPWSLCNVLPYFL